jgi:predicted membrane protein
MLPKIGSGRSYKFYQRVGVLALFTDFIRQWPKMTRQQVLNHLWWLSGSKFHSSAVYIGSIMKNSNPEQRKFIGGLIVTIGVLALVDKFNLFNIGHLFQFWPTIFIVVGLLKIAKAKHRASVVLGAGLVLLGVVVVLKNHGFLQFNWADMWPFILIVVGLSIVFRDRPSASGKTPWNEDGTSTDSSLIDITAVMGGNKTLNSSQDFKGGEITAIMGGVELDLRNASMQSEAALNLWASWGGIVLKVPQDWVVINRGFAILGGIEDKTISSPSSSKRLIITGTAIMGGVEIKN